MRIGMIGVNHKLASLEMREQIARLCARRFADHRILHPYFSYVLLSTCNRTEIYFHSPELSQTHVYLLGILRYGIGENIDQRFYSFFGCDCFCHLTRVTAGLDSAILGETEIQGQVKVAYSQASQQRKLAKELHFLFQKSLKLAKEIRTYVGQGRFPVLAKTIVETATQMLGDLSLCRILFIGFSHINQTVAAWFEKQCIKNFTYCNRHVEKLQTLQLPYLLWEHKERWVDYDLIILGTKAEHYIIEQLPQAIARPKLLIDLSVPRNVAPSLGQEPHIKLLNIDQLSALAQCPFVKEEEPMDVQYLLRSVRKQMGIFEFKEQNKKRICHQSRSPSLSTVP
ncbi:MAG: glutamyl-tRNA reductase [Verrucomicrobia bacterium]|nr:glutamyl-tRNA reductase [Verrucomicrobiota bacterium]